MDWTAIGTVITVLGGVWAIVTYKTDALERRMDKHEERTLSLLAAQEERTLSSLAAQDEKVFSILAAQDEKIFQLATGKTLREAMMEAKKAKEK